MRGFPVPLELHRLTLLNVARDLLREALTRRWFLALFIGITLILLTLGMSLEMDVVDGALAGVRLFGSVLDTSIRSVDTALRPVFMAAAAAIFYGGTAFMILASSDFAPSLLSPGRIEHLLSLPVRRWQLLAGTYLGVIALSIVCALYGAGGLAVILGLKTGVWTWGPILAALLAVANFATLYAAMVASAIFARSTALSAAVGTSLFAFGIIAGLREQIAPLFEEGLGRAAFEAATRAVPRVSTLGTAAIDIAGARPIDQGGFALLIAGFGVFALAVLALGAWRFEQRDF
ncbi:MAG TPA: ABC transporter permease subunit [Myxococcaceae bacterium]|nr:ABC transporter permease subunit [Myxococcaceae bacterium]